MFGPSLLAFFFFFHTLTLISSWNHGFQLENSRLKTIINKTINTVQTINPWVSTNFNDSINNKHHNNKSIVKIKIEKCYLKWKNVMKDMRSDENRKRWRWKDVRIEWILWLVKMKIIYLVARIFSWQSAICKRKNRIYSLSGHTFQ